MTTLRAMGIGEPEHFRCRTYGDDTDSVQDARRAALVAEMASAAGWVALDSASHDRAVAALQERGWLPPQPDLEPNPSGPGRVGRWRLTALGRQEWAAMKAGGL